MECSPFPGHGRNGLRATYPENAVRARQMANRDHRRMRSRRQTGDDLFAARHRRRDNRHHRRREDRVTPTRYVAAHRLHRDDPVTEMYARQRLNFQRLHGRQLRLRKTTHLINSKLAVAARLGIHPLQCFGDLLLAHLKLRRHDVIKLLRKGS